MFGAVPLPPLIPRPPLEPPLEPPLDWDTISTSGLTTLTEMESGRLTLGRGAGDILVMVVPWRGVTIHV